MDKENSQVVQWLGLGAFTMVAWVQSVAGELRSYKLQGRAKQKEGVNQSVELFLFLQSKRMREYNHRYCCPQYCEIKLKSYEQNRNVLFSPHTWFSFERKKCDLCNLLLTGRRLNVFFFILLKNAIMFIFKNSFKYFCKINSAKETEVRKVYTFKIIIPTARSLLKKLHWFIL